MLILQTLLAATWRCLVALFDWRTLLRKLKGQPVVDVVFISNMRDRTDRKRFLGLWRPKCGHFNGPRYWLNGIVGRTRALDVVTEDLNSEEGRKKAKKYFISATFWAKRNGAKVILLAASTKRIFGEDAAELKELFPELTFTIGDNGTFLLLREETLRAIKNAKLKPPCRIAILGPYGFLGEMMVKTLSQMGYNMIGAGPNTSALKRVAENYKIETCQNFAEMGKVDAIVACTHSEKIRLNNESIELIRKPNKKLLVVDVSEPANLRYKEFQKCRNVVIRQDAGNAYSEHLKYVLGAISYKMFRLTKGVTFGCFAEALAIRRSNKKIDWLIVNESNMKIISNLFTREEIIPPSPRCFGKKINSFNLSLKTQIKDKKSQLTNLKIAFDKIMNVIF